MARVYIPGLKVSAHVHHQAHRMLPIPGEVLVKTGDRVRAEDVIAQALLPGDVTPLNLAKLLALEPADVTGCMLVDQGATIAPGTPLARTKGIFGMFRNEYVSPIRGTIESISPVTGQVIVRGEALPLQVRAYLAGTVVEILPNEGCVIEADVTFVQGIFGIGGEAFGPIRMASHQHDRQLTADMIHPDMKGSVVVGGARITAEAMEKARSVGVSALISGGIDDADLSKILGYDLGVAITGSEQVGFTLIITEGFGEIAMAERTFKLLASREGRDSAVNGATQIRAGVMRPEIVIPLSIEELAGVPNTVLYDGALEIGAAVRVIRDPYFGKIGKVGALPAEPAELPSGSRARVLEVKFSSGENAIIPRANVELIEG